MNYRKSRFKIEMKQPLAEALKQRIETILENDPANDDDKLHYAVLAEIKDRFHARTGICVTHSVHRLYQ